MFLVSCDPHAPIEGQGVDLVDQFIRNGIVVVSCDPHAQLKGRVWTSFIKLSEVIAFGFMRSTRPIEGRGVDLLDQLI